jgi:hypothetical protein
VQATAAPSAPAKPEIASAVDVLKKAAADASVPSVQVFNALRELEQAKLQVGLRLTAICALFWLAKQAGWRPRDCWPTCHAHLSHCHVALLAFLLLFSLAAK